MTAFDPLWVPILTHYDAAGELDRVRTAEQIRAITPHVRQFLIGGTTGDGWQMTDDVLDAWLRVAADPVIVTSRHTLMVGALSDTTEGVIRRARRVEKALAKAPTAARFAGHAVCPPKGADTAQERILDHYRQVIAATRLPVAIYQLPQVVACEVAPETFAKIAAEPRVTLFKDTSGIDTVAGAGLGTNQVRMVRGAEGDYARHLKPGGAYDGWLLSTANGFAPELRQIADAVAAGESAQAEELSRRLTTLFAELFALAEQEVPEGNPFSNTNRAVDHVLAHGEHWPDHPARLVSGGTLPRAFLAAVAERIAAAGKAVGAGYRP